MVQIYHISALLWAFDIPISKISVILAQIELIADPYRFLIWIANTHDKIKKDLSTM